MKRAFLDITRGPPTICITMDVWGFAELHYSVWLTNDQCKFLLCSHFG